MDLWGSTNADRCTANNFYGCMRTAGAGGNFINPIMSGKVTTSNSFTFKYGRVEVRAKIPSGDWIWPAIWAMPAEAEYGGWPASGEIDIMESRGNANYDKSVGGAERVLSTLHWGPDFAGNSFQKTTNFQVAGSGLYSDDFHTYGLYWDDTVLYTYIDNPTNRVLTVNHGEQSYWDRGEFQSQKPYYFNPWSTSKNKCAPFDKQYYLILNVAVGGTGGYWPDGKGGKPWSNTSPHAVNEFYDAQG